MQDIRLDRTRGNPLVCHATMDTVTPNIMEMIPACHATRDTITPNITDMIPVCHVTRAINTMASHAASADMVI